MGIGVLNPTDAIGHRVHGLVFETSVCYWQNQPVETQRMLLDIGVETQRMLLGIGVLNPTAAAAPTLEILEQAPAGFRDSERDRRQWTILA